MPEKIYNLAKASLGKDIAATQNELGCAESISYLLNKANVANFPKAGYLGTSDFYNWLKKFAMPVDTPIRGDIIISPTGTSTKGAQHGHIGIVALYGVLSNNSMNGLFMEYYTIDSWRTYYGGKLGFPVLFFRVNEVIPICR